MSHQVWKLSTQISADGSNIIIQCESGLEEETTYSIVVTDGVKLNLTNL